MLLTTSHTANAATNQANMNSKVTVASTCTISVADMDFGNIAAAVTGQDTYNKIDVLCSNKVSYSVIFNAGPYSASVANRSMKHETTDDYLRYVLYKDTGGVVLGGISDTSRINGSGTGTVQSFNFRARLANSQFVRMGKYSDTIHVIIYY